MTQRMGDGLLDQYVSRRLINRLASTLLVTDVPEATVEAFCDELTRQVLARLDVLKQQEERREERSMSDYSNTFVSIRHAKRAFLDELAGLQAEAREEARERGRSHE